MLKMNNQMLLVVHFDGEMVNTTEEGCVFHSRYKIGMRFNKCVMRAKMKRKISAKIATCCGKQMSRLFYKFPISTNPLKFLNMELVDDDDMTTMIANYSPLRSRISDRLIYLQS